MTKLNLFNDYELLEDRVTHAFLSTLDQLRQQTQRAILHDIFQACNDGADKVPQLRNAGITFDIQNPSMVNMAEFETADEGYLVTITQPDAKLHESSGEAEGKSRLDGWIFDGKTLIGLESKLGSKLNTDQLDRHADNSVLQTTEGEVHRIFNLLTWQDMDSSIRDFRRSDDITATESSVLDQFLEFLYMTGVTMNFEKLYNQQKFDVQKNWQGELPKQTLDLLVNKVAKKSDSDVPLSTDEQRHQTRENYYWKRIYFNDEGTVTDGADWRSTMYIRRRAVSADMMIFGPGDTDFPLFKSFLKEYIKQWQAEDNSNYDLRRSYLQILNYGKRKKAQKGRDHSYGNLNLCLGEHGSVYEPDLEDSFEEIEAIQDIIDPKQMAVRYRIANPGGSYWQEDREQDSINDEDANLLRTPNDVVAKLVTFVENALVARHKAIQKHVK